MLYQFAAIDSQKQWLHSVGASHLLRAKMILLLITTLLGYVFCDRLQSKSKQCMSGTLNWQWYFPTTRFSIVWLVEAYQGWYRNLLLHAIILVLWSFLVVEPRGMSVGIWVWDPNNSIPQISLMFFSTISGDQIAYYSPRVLRVRCFVLWIQEQFWERHSSIVLKFVQITSFRGRPVQERYKPTIFLSAPTRE